MRKDQPKDQPKVVLTLSTIIHEERPAWRPTKSGLNSQSTCDYEERPAWRPTESGLNSQSTCDSEETPA